MKPRSDITTGQKVLAAYNFLTAAAVMYDYTQNPNAANSEYLPDVAIHTLSGLVSLGLLDTLESQVVAAGGNLARIAQIAYKLLIAGNSSIATAANIADVANHTANLYSFYNHKKPVKDDKSVAHETQQDKENHKSAKKNH